MSEKSLLYEFEKYYNDYLVPFLVFEQTNKIQQLCLAIDFNIYVGFATGFVGRGRVCLPIPARDSDQLWYVCQPTEVSSAQHASMHHQRFPMLRLNSSTNMLRYLPRSFLTYYLLNSIPNCMLSFDFRKLL